MDREKLLIIIPAYNEEKSIESVIEQILKDNNHFDYVIVNDGSSDNTASLCKERGYNFLDLPVNLGLFGAMQTGFKYAYYNGYDYAIQVDGDGQHDVKFIKEMYDYVKKNDVDILIGSRFVGNQTRIKNLRQFGGKILSGLIFLTTGKKIYDPTSGMRIYGKKPIERMAFEINNRPEPDTLAYFLRCGMKIDEYPVVMMDRANGESYLNITNSIKYMLVMITSIIIIQWFRKKV